MANTDPLGVDTSGDRTPDWADDPDDNGLQRPEEAVGTLPTLADSHGGAELRPEIETDPLENVPTRNLRPLQGPLGQGGGFRRD